MKILITGASRGIGLCMAELFAAQGHRVFANYRSSRDKLNALEGDITPVYADVTLRADVEAMFAQAGAVDVLVNNAGIAQFLPFADMEEEDWDAMMAGSLKPVYLCSKAALPGMLRKQSGCMINISSVFGETGGSCEAHYSAAKAGIIGFTKALAKELGPSGIRVNGIAPGVIATDMTAGFTPEELRDLAEQAPLRKIGSPQDVARAALYLAQSEFITGEVLRVNGGWHI